MENSAKDRNIDSFHDEDSYQSPAELKAYMEVVWGPPVVVNDYDAYSKAISPKPETEADSLLEEGLGKQGRLDYINLVFGEKEFKGPLNLNGDEYLSRAELKSAAKSNPLARYLLENYDSYKPDANGITSKDLEEKLINSLDTRIMRNKIKESVPNLSLDALGNSEQSLHSLNIKDDLRGINLNYRGGSLKFERTSSESETKELSSQNYDSADAGKVKALGSDLFKAYRNLIDLGKPATFDEIDANLDGHLSSLELNIFADAHPSSLQNDNLGMANTARSAADSIAYIEEMSDDEFGDENDGITSFDLVEDFLEKAYENKAEVTEQIEARLRDGLPGTRTTGGSVEDTMTGIEAENGAVNSFIEIHDAQREVDLRVDFMEGLFSTHKAMDIDYR